MRAISSGRPSAVDESRSLPRAGKPDGDVSRGCSPPPGNELADTAIKEALEKAETARQAAAARTAADSAAGVGTMRLDKERMSGATASHPAAAVSSVPLALPAISPAAPGLSR